MVDQVERLKRLLGPNASKLPDGGKQLEVKISSLEHSIATALKEAETQTTTSKASPESNSILRPLEKATASIASSPAGTGAPQHQAVSQSSTSEARVSVPLHGVVHKDLMHQQEQPLHRHKQADSRGVSLGAPVSAVKLTQPQTLPFPSEADASSEVQIPQISQHVGTDL